MFLQWVVLEAFTSLSCSVYFVLFIFLYFLFSFWVILCIMDEDTCHFS